MHRFWLWSAVILITPVHFACKDSLPVPAGLDGDCSPEVVAALDRRDTRGVKDLIDRGAVVNCGRTAERLEHAVRDDRSDAVALLLSAGVNPNRGWGEFSSVSRTTYLAVEERLFRGRSLKVLRLLLEHGADPNQREVYSWNRRLEYADDSKMRIGAPSSSCVWRSH